MKEKGDVGMRGKENGKMFLTKFDLNATKKASERTSRPKI